MKILLIRFSSAGDIILASAFVRCCRARFPEATIDFITTSTFAPLLQHSPYLDRIITIEPGTSLGELVRLKSGLIEENGGDYDIVFDLHNSIRSRYFRATIGRQTAIIRKPTFRKWLLVHRKINRLRPIVPMAERYLAVGAPFGIVNDGLGLELPIGNTHPPILPVSGRATIALAPGARHATKRWPADRFAELGRMLARRYDARIILLGGEAERALCAEVMHAIGGDVVNLSGRISFLESAAAIDICSVVVTNDSAIAHIAAARKRPVVTIFGSTVTEFGFAPYAVPNVVVENVGLYCRPCTSIGRADCPEGHFRCMLEITPEMVAVAVGELQA
jgi:heptosyltransferase-2